MEVTETGRTSGVAAELHKQVRGENGSPTPRPAPPQSYRPMNRDFQIRFTAVLLTLLTVAAVTLAWINFQKEQSFQVPNDGVSWNEKSGKLVAERVDPEGPGAR